MHRICFKQREREREGERERERDYDVRVKERCDELSGTELNG